MYTSTATVQSNVSVERSFPILQTELYINMGDCYQYIKVINTPNFLQKDNQQSKGETGSSQQIRFYININHINTHVVEVLSKGSETTHHKGFLCLHEETHTIFRQMLPQFQKGPLKINVFFCLLTYFHSLSLTSEMLI